MVIVRDCQKKNQIIIIILVSSSYKAFLLIITAVFANGLNWRKWIGIIADLIDVRKKVRIFCIKK